MALFKLFYAQEVVKDGLRFPAVGLDNPSTVSFILLQQPGKLKAKQIREGKENAKNLAAMTVCWGFVVKRVKFKSYNVFPCSCSGSKRCNWQHKTDESKCRNLP